MAPWHAMPPQEAAVKTAALAEVRSAFAGIRCAAELIARNAHSSHERSLAWTIAKSAARGERAVARLQQAPKIETAGSSFRTARRLRTGYPESGD